MSTFRAQLAVLQPRLAGLLSDSQKASSIQLVRKLIAGYRSSAVAVDERHAPSLYARFLDNILSKRFSPGGDGQDAPSVNERTYLGPSSRSPSAAPSSSSSDGSQPFYTSVFSVVPPTGVRTPAPPEPPMYGGQAFDIDTWNFEAMPSFNGGDRAYGFATDPAIPGSQKFVLSISQTFLFEAYGAGSVWNFT
jgi:hypothetical protein